MKLSLSLTHDLYLRCQGLNDASSIQMNLAFKDAKQEK